MPIYQYDQPAPNRFAGSIGDILQQQGAIQARRAEQIGQAQARAAEQGGQAWGNAVQNIGQTVGAIPAQLQQQKQQASRAEADAIALRTAKRGESDVTALDQAFKLGDRDAILNSLPGHLRPGIAKQFADADASAGRLHKLQSELEQANTEYLSGLGASVAEHGYDLGATGLALMHARNTYEKTGNTAMIAKIDEIAQQIQSDPNSIKAVVDGVIKASPKRAELLQTAAHQTAQEEHATTAAEETERHNKALEAAAKLTSGRAEAMAAETARHNKVTEGLGAQRNANAAAAKGDVTDLSPAGIDMAALNYRKTGVLPALGMGDKTTRKNIINRSATLTAEDIARIESGGTDIAGNKATFSANASSLTGLQKQRDAIGAFEQTAAKNIDIFLSTAGKIVDTGSPLANGIARHISGKVLGSPDQAAYDAARQVAINEIAKITSNPNLSGTLSDSARHEVDAFNPTTATLKQTVAVMRLLKRDMENRTHALDEQIVAIKGRIGGGGAAPAAKPGTVRARDPQGNLHEAPAGTPLPAGWKLEG